MIRRIFDDRTRELIDAINEEILYMRAVLEHKFFSFFKALSFYGDKNSLISLGFKSESLPFFEPMSPVLSFLPPYIMNYDEYMTSYSPLFDDDVFFPEATYITNEPFYIDGVGYVEGEFTIPSEGFYIIREYTHNTQAVWKNPKEAEIEEGDLIPIINPGYLNFFSRIFRLWGKTGGWDTASDCLLMQIEKLKNLMFAPSIENIDKFLKSLYCFDADNPPPFTLPQSVINPYYSAVKINPPYLTIPVFRFHETINVPVQAEEYRPSATITRYFYVPIGFKKSRYLVEIPPDRIAHYVENSGFSYFEGGEITQSTNFEHAFIPPEPSVVVVRYSEEIFNSSFYPPLHIFFEGIATLREILPQKVPLLIGIDSVMTSVV